MSDLVQRLRYLAEHLHDDGLLDYCDLAARGADRIEALEAALQKINQLNSYDRVQELMRWFIANGELADYDDELANTCKIAIEICDIARRALEGNCTEPISLA